MEQIRVERIPLVFQTNVHTTYTTVPFVQEGRFELSKNRS